MLACKVWHIAHKHEHEHCQMPSDGPGLTASVASPGRSNCNNNNSGNNNVRYGALALAMLCTSELLTASPTLSSAKSRSKHTQPAAPCASLSASLVEAVEGSGHVFRDLWCRLLLSSAPTEHALVSHPLPHIACRCRTMQIASCFLHKSQLPDHSCSASYRIKQRPDFAKFADHQYNKRHDRHLQTRMITKAKLTFFAESGNSWWPKAFWRHYWISLNSALTFALLNNVELLLALAPGGLVLALHALLGFILVLLFPSRSHVCRTGLLLSLERNLFRLLAYLHAMQICINAHVYAKPLLSAYFICCTAWDYRM